MVWQAVLYICGIEVDLENIWPCVAEESCGNVCFAVLVYVVSDVMDRRTYDTLLYYHVFYDKLAIAYT